MTPNHSDPPQDVWKTQNDETQMARIKARPEELAALVRSRQSLNRFAYWTAVSVMSALAAGFLYNVWSANEPWIRFGQAWALGLLAYVLGTQLRYRAGRRGAYETCVRFLERQHEERAKGYLRIRGWLWLLIPCLVASWLGKGPLIAAKASGLDPSSRLFRFCAGPWPFLLIIAALVLVWLAFGAAADKARRDAKEIQASVAGNAGLLDNG
jgi:hypothetical protein